MISGCIATLSMDNFPLSIKESNARRAKYYEEGKKKLPQKYQTSSYEYRKDNKGRSFLYNKSTGERVIANSKTVGTPKHTVINGQKLYNHIYHHATRNKIMNVLHEYFEDKCKGLSPFHEFPLMLEGDLLMPTDRVAQNWDVDNFQFPYVKAFHDTLTKLNLIPDDHSRVISKPLSFHYTPANEYRMIIRFYVDQRLIWKNYPVYTK